MNLLAGALNHDARAPMDAGLAPAMAARVTGGRPPCVLATDGAVFLSTGRAGRLARHGHTVVAAETDAAQLDAFLALTRPAPDSGSPAAPMPASTAVSRLAGAFALAHWDGGPRDLTLAVDRFGIKRLYYLLTDQGFAFATRAGALLALPGAQRRVDPDVVYQYLNFGFVPAPACIYAGIRRLPPAHVLRLRDGALSVTAYWDMAYRERPLPVGEAAAATYRMVQAAVSTSLVGADPAETGAFLSGGTDSSTVLGLMATATGERPHAFSIGFREPQYDELGYAELAARHFNAHHHTAIVGPETALAVLPDLVEAYDEPFGNDSTIPTYLCARLARDHGMSRLLAGDGGDEIFGGNERYRTDRVFARYGAVPAVMRKGLIEPLLGVLPPWGPLGRAQRYVRRANLPNPRRFYSYEFFVAREASALLAPEFLRAVDRDAPWRRLHEHFDRPEASSELNRLLYLDLKLTIGDSDLFKVTRTADHAGLDVRFPMLDHSLVEFTGTLPARYKVNGLEKRYLFKRTFAPLLPAATLSKTKHGFGMPVATWLRSHPGFQTLAVDTLLAPDAFTRSYLTRESMQRLLALHAGDTTAYYGSIVWMILMLELWGRRHMGLGGGV